MGSIGGWIRVAGLGAGLLASAVEAQDKDSLPTSAQLKDLSIEELMDFKVTLVSRRAEELSRTASSIQIITREEIRRAGVFTLPGALRLASNLQVARIDARQWAITARGQNASTANKLLVMIDGRSVYTPLYAGVFWDVQDVLLDDIDHIEVISGPGGALWGANAVNGVVNIVTRPAEEVAGGYAAAAAGTYMRDLEEVRAGGRLFRNLHAYVWGRRFRHNPSDRPGGGRARDGWGYSQNGFRADWVPDENQRLTVIGGLYQGLEDLDQPGRAQLDGQHLQVRWSREARTAGTFQIQAYFDRSARLIPATFDEDLRAWDLDFQHLLPLGDRNVLTWGAGFRLSQDDVANSELLQFRPAYRDMRDLNLFAQDEIEALRDRVLITLGARMQRTAYSGFEFMPSARAAWTPDARNTLWAAVSRAVRAPSRIDVDFHLPPQPPDLPVELQGGPDFESEYLTAYEAGWRTRMRSVLSASFSGFYNRYSDLRIVEAASDSALVIANGADQDIYGLETDLGWQATPWWRWRLGGTWLAKDFRYRSGIDYLPLSGIGGDDPSSQYSLRWMLDLPRGMSADLWVRYVSELSGPPVPYYASAGATLGIAWRNLEASVSGQDLSERRHLEFRSAADEEVPRSFAARIGARF